MNFISHKFLFYNFFFITLIKFGSCWFGSSSSEPLNPNGYIVFCPCMGRFKNQVEQFLGALSFANDTGRTLVLPYWVEYPEVPTKDDLSTQVPFESFFKIEPIKQFTSVITMDDFLQISPKVWPKGKRTVFCFEYRSGKSCKAKEGNPFGPYWSKFKIEFDRDESYAPLGYDMSHEDQKNGWNQNYSVSKYPVLAFTGAPGSFPILEKDVPLQKYLKWSDSIEKKATDFISKFKSNKNDKFIGIHLRNGVDFYRVCEHAREETGHTGHFLSSAQCLGFHMEKGAMTEELCYPSDETYINQLEEALKETNAKYVYIVADSIDILDKFKEKFPKTNFIQYDKKGYHVDLAILGKADHAIVNCVSTYSALVKRERDVDGKTTEFWAYKQKDRSEL